MLYRLDFTYYKLREYEVESKLVRLLPFLSFHLRDEQASGMHDLMFLLKMWIKYAAWGQ